MYYGLSNNSTAVKSFIVAAQILRRGNIDKCISHASAQTCKLWAIIDWYGWTIATEQLVSPCSH